MASTSSLCSSFLSFDPFLYSPKTKSISTSRIRINRVFALRRDAHNPGFDGKLVDESMVVLRKRIQEMKMTEGYYAPPEEWMDWEKRVYATYDSIICDAVGHLQICLMETRPIVALVIVALIAVSLPTCAVVVVVNLVELGSGILSGIRQSS